MYHRELKGPKNKSRSESNNCQNDDDDDIDASHQQLDGSYDVDSNLDDKFLKNSKR